MELLHTCMAPPGWSQDVGQGPDWEPSHSHKFAVQGVTPKSITRIFSTLVSSETRRLSCLGAGSAVTKLLTIPATKSALKSGIS